MRTAHDLKDSCTTFVLDVSMKPISEVEDWKAFAWLKAAQQLQLSMYPTSANEICRSHYVLNKVVQGCLAMQWYTIWLAQRHYYIVPKKGELTDCNNWCTISLLLVAGKICSSILLDRRKDTVDGRNRGLSKEEEPALIKSSLSCKLSKTQLIIPDCGIWILPTTLLWWTRHKPERQVNCSSREVSWKVGLCWNAGKC